MFSGFKTSEWMALKESHLQVVSPCKKMSGAGGASSGSYKNKLQGVTVVLYSGLRMGIYHIIMVKPDFVETIRINHFSHFPAFLRALPKKR